MISRRAFLALSGATLGISGCGGDSSLNPFSWFRSEPEAETLSIMEIQQRTEDRPLIAEITDLSVERLPGGAIIHATGLPSVQGWYDAQLVASNESPAGVLSFDFRARPPKTATRISTPWSREIVAAAYISDIELAGISQIRVAAAQNARTARR